MKKNQSVGERLKEARGKDYTQEQVAEFLDVHRFTYAKWEQGLHPPGKKSYIDDLARLFNCSVDWLRDGKGEKGTFTPALQVADGRNKKIATTRRARPNASIGLPTLTPAQQIVLQMVTKDILALSDGELLLWHTRYLSSNSL